MANIYLIQDRRRALADGTFKIRLRVSDKRKSSYISLDYSCDEATFEKIKSRKNLGKLSKELEKHIYTPEKKAREILEDLHPFSFDKFLIRFNRKGDPRDLISLLHNKAIELRADGNISNSNIYKQAGNLLRMFAHFQENKGKIEKTALENVVLDINSLDVKQLKAFEIWAVKQGYSLTTVSMYLVRCKAIFNGLIRTNEFDKNKYPFGKSSDGFYQIPKATNAKRPLSMAEIMALYFYEPISELQSFSRDIFMFSYLANGMNLYDVFKLRWSDIDKDRFTFIRQKTKGKKSDKITVLLNDDIQAIIDRHGVRQLGIDYVFPVLNQIDSIEIENKKVRCKVTSINQVLKIIAKKLEIPTTISSYFARHSFASNLMQGEAPLAFISKKLGHSDLATTQNYLAQFSKESEEIYTAKLLQKNI